MHSEPSENMGSSKHPRIESKSLDFTSDTEGLFFTFDLKVVSSTSLDCSS